MIFFLLFEIIRFLRVELEPRESNLLVLLFLENILDFPFIY